MGAQRVVGMYDGNIVCLKTDRAHVIFGTNPPLDIQRDCEEGGDIRFMIDGHLMDVVEHHQAALIDKFVADQQRMKLLFICHNYFQFDCKNNHFLSVLQQKRKYCKTLPISRYGFFVIFPLPL
jgi:hypothetical protein